MFKNLLLINSFIFPFIEKIFGFKLGFDLIIYSPYLVYVITGYYLGISIENNKKKYIIGLIVSSIIICFAEFISGLYPSNAVLNKFNLLGNYDSLVILILSICIFKLVKNINASNKYISYMTDETYGIYLIHMFWINLIYKFFKFNIYGDCFFIKPIMIFLIVLILSFVSTKILKKIPFIKNII